MATPTEWAGARDIVECGDCGRAFDRLTTRHCPWCATVDAAYHAMQAHLATCKSTFTTCEEHHRLYAILTDAEDARRHGV
jgi:hypothetical protein